MFGKGLFVHIFDIVSLFAAELKKPKIGILDKGLISLMLRYRTSDRNLYHFRKLDRRKSLGS